MTGRVIAAVIVHTFGRHARTPRETAWRRLICAFAFATALNVVITQSLGTLRLPGDLFQGWLTIMLILAVQIVVGIIMLIVRASGYGLHDDQINDLLGVLPVHEPARWLVGLIPGLCAIAMLLVMAIGPLIVIASILHLHWGLFVFGLVVGLISGVGLGSYQPHASLGINFLLMGALVAAELHLLERMMTVYQIYEDPFVFGVGALVTLILVPFYWLFRSSVTWSLSRQRSVARLAIIKLIPIRLDSWMSTKVMRHPKVLRSGLVLTGISGLIAYFWLQSGGGNDPNVSTVLLGLSFLASLASTDIRSLTRPQAAPEMIMVRGSRHFVLQQIVIAMLLSAVITLPLWLSLLVTHPSSLSVYLGVLGQLALGSTVALLASTLFVPSQQDISAEFFGAAVSTCLIIGLEKLTASLRISTDLRSEALIWMALSVGLAGAIFSVEQRRNNYYWKGNIAHVS